MVKHRVYGSIPESLNNKALGYIGSTGCNMSDLITRALENFLSKEVVLVDDLIKGQGLILKAEEIVKEEIPTPGPGAVSRLKAMGIDPIEVVKARRAKRHGREYDKSLEPYFDQV